MINNQKVLAIIPARGGSKGVLRKNVRLLGDKPLIAWTIDAAKKSKYIDRLILSSEDEEIIMVAKEYQCDVPFVRPSYLAEDDTPGIDPVIHAVTEIKGYDLVVLLQPTSPFRETIDIDSAIEKLIKYQARVLTSVVEAKDSPYWMYIIEDEKMVPVINETEKKSRRQDIPNIYSLNGAIYIAQVPWLITNKTFITSETIPFVMSKENSLDIDEEEDFSLSEYLMKYR